MKINILLLLILSFFSTQINAQKFITGFQRSKYLEKIGKISKSNGQFDLGNGEKLDISYNIRDFFKKDGLNNDFWTKDGKDIVGNTYISGGMDDKVDAGLIFTELYSDLVGPLKISIASSLATNKDSIYNSTQTFLLGGGNFITKADIPLFTVGHPLRNLTIMGSSRFGGNIPTISNTSSSFLYYGNIQAQAHFLIMGDRQNFGVLGKIHFGGFWTNQGFVGNVVNVDVAEANKDKVNLTPQTKKIGYRFGASLGFFLAKLDLIISVDFPERFTGKYKEQARALPPYLSVTRQIWFKSKD